MKTLLLVFFLSLIPSKAPAQQTIMGVPTIDSLEKRLTLSKADTNRVLILLNLLENYYRRNREMARTYAHDGLTLSRKLKYAKGESACLRWLGLILVGEWRFTLCKN